MIDPVHAHPCGCGPFHRTCFELYVEAAPTCPLCLTHLSFFVLAIHAERYGLGGKEFLLSTTASSFAQWWPRYLLAPIEAQLVAFEAPPLFPDLASPVLSPLSVSCPRSLTPCMLDPPFSLDAVVAYHAYAYE